jgi:hypothetical protein
MFRMRIDSLSPRLGRRKAIPFSRRVLRPSYGNAISRKRSVARMKQSEIRGRPRSLNADPGCRFAYPGYKKKKGGRTPTDACQTIRITANKSTQFAQTHLLHAARAESAARSPVGVPPRRLLRRANATARLQLRASWDLVGRNDPDGSKDRALFRGRYPRLPVPVQRVAPQTGHHAGRA